MIFPKYVCLIWKNVKRTSRITLGWIWKINFKKYKIYNCCQIDHFSYDFFLCKMGYTYYMYISNKIGPMSRLSLTSFRLILLTELFQKLNNLYQGNLKFPNATKLYLDLSSHTLTENQQDSLDLGSKYLFKRKVDPFQEKMLNVK